MFDGPRDDPEETHRGSSTIDSNVMRHMHIAHGHPDSRLPRRLAMPLMAYPRRKGVGSESEVVGDGSQSRRPHVDDAKSGIAGGSAMAAKADEGGGEPTGRRGRGTGRAAASR
jgi:hypothetical protein